MDSRLSPICSGSVEVNDLYRTEGGKLLQGALLPAPGCECSEKRFALLFAAQLDDTTIVGGAGGEVKVA